VNVIDDSFGVTVYNITSPVQVMPNQNLANNLLADFSANDPKSPFVTSLQSGNLNTISKTIIGIASVFNIENLTNATQNNSQSVIQVLISHKWHELLQKNLNLGINRSDRTKSTTAGVID
jgi:hypothetical protein